jgi:hypothetical protein
MAGGTGQCPPVLVAEVSLGQVKALDTELAGVHNVEFLMSRGEDFRKGFTAYDLN